MRDVQQHTLMECIQNELLRASCIDSAKRLLAAYLNGVLSTTNEIKRTIKLADSRLMYTMVSKFIFDVKLYCIMSIWDDVVAQQKSSISNLKRNYNNTVA